LQIVGPVGGHMCGIMGYLGSEEASPILLQGLANLEYRGYDSSGLSILSHAGEFQTIKSTGRLNALTSLVEKENPQGSVGIGHTRWATHGRVTVENSHPHLDCDDSIAVVQNGIIENYREIKEELQNDGHNFKSDTDSEVISHLIEDAIGKGQTLENAVEFALSQVQGSVTLLVTQSEIEPKIVAARIGNAGGLVIGVEGKQTFVASDIPALLPFSNNMIFLNPGEMAILSLNGIEFIDVGGQKIEKQVSTQMIDVSEPDKGEYDWFMYKEIMDQPDVLLNVLRGRVEMDKLLLEMPELDSINEKLDKIDRVILMGCGTSYHASLVGKGFIESITKLPAQAEIASEFRYANQVIRNTDLVIALTQSGETADTLEAMAKVKKAGAVLIAVTNVLDSQSTRIADASLDLRAGLEVGVASTKTFTASLLVLYLLSIYLGKTMSTIEKTDLEKYIFDLEKLPDYVGRALNESNTIHELAKDYINTEHFLFMARGQLFPIALEGALKLKEISYIHAEGHPAGEMKHGPIALIGPDVTTIALAPDVPQREKTETTIEEIKTRDGVVLGVITSGNDKLDLSLDNSIKLPAVPSELVPIVAAIPMQLFAYFIALEKGLDIDHPRNLAKSVTVE